MFKQGDYIVYRKEVVKVIDIKKNQLNNEQYYVLVPVNDDSLRIDVPTDNRLGNLRPLLTKDEVKSLIKKIPNILPIGNSNKLIENDYRDLLNVGGHDNLIKIIKTTYLRNKKRLDNNKKIGEKDNYYFELAERYLYTEISFALNISYDEAKEYVINETVKAVNQR